MIDWSILRPTQKGLAVEGQDDKLLVETFLEAGEKQGYWQNWRSYLIVEIAKGRNRQGFSGVLDEIEQNRNGQNIWGLIDRDWRTDAEIAAMRSTTARLIVLPRRMIENYCIDPDEFLPMLPKVQRDTVNEPELRAWIESSLANWLKHGALSAVLHENGANDFCRGASGYPNRLLTTLVTDENEISTTLQMWHRKLEPTPLLNNYQMRTVAFQQRTLQEHYRDCVNGKAFFNQVVVPDILNKQLGQRKSDYWFRTLMSGCTICPADIQPLLSQLL